MKKVISLLAVAAFALTFAAGCGNKRPDCGKLSKEDCGKEGNNAMVCVLNGETCEERADADICTNAAKDKATCDKAAGLLKGKGTCNFNEADKTCTLGDKQ
ncbi:MAG: hypothetical protein KC505_04485 [Myxococcales bacterium]|nr:hypothetical protein [Myxococcales bacterium]USN50971.1 MAG: hypothetical protein H6731_00715 [Myxococcales bacterium]